MRAPFKGEIENFHKSLASLGEIAVFAVLGLTLHLSDLGPTSVWLDGLLIALLLAFVIRPLVVAPLLAPVRLRLGERIFVMWGGLKGAVPILLGILVLLEGASGASRVYGIIFVVVAFSVVVQGSTMPFLARRLGVPMRVGRADAVGRLASFQGRASLGPALQRLRGLACARKADQRAPARRSLLDQHGDPRRRAGPAARIDRPPAG